MAEVPSLCLPTRPRLPSMYGSPTAGAPDNPIDLTLDDDDVDDDEDDENDSESSDPNLPVIAFVGSSGPFTYVSKEGPDGDVPLRGRSEQRAFFARAADVDLPQPFDLDYIDVSHLSTTSGPAKKRKEFTPTGSNSPPRKRQIQRPTPSPSRTSSPVASSSSNAPPVAKKRVTMDDISAALLKNTPIHGGTAPISLRPIRPGTEAKRRARMNLDSDAQKAKARQLIAHYKAEEDSLMLQKK